MRGGEAVFIDRAQPYQLHKAIWDRPLDEVEITGPKDGASSITAVRREHLAFNDDNTPLNSTPDVAHLVTVVPSKNWSTNVPHSVVILDHERTVVAQTQPHSLIVSKRTFGIAFDSQVRGSLFQGGTVSGHTVVCNEDGGVMTLLEGGGSVYQVLEQDINRSHTPTQIPFMCSFSGTIGYVGRLGQIFIWQQK